ncbi:hypothetical protein EZV62_008253 [Acer yangbiense]|uniref:NB-ARC domain-containing protein n=1 Tax=Acer yangbiense TaxID=1000413 RepID=A0A5C7ID63_9ROSI|nr:hypothetical protein EZV62_008253 [Acer yangbiense]
MEIAVGIVSSILSKIGDYLLESTVHQVGYFIYFNNIVEDLRKQDEYLRLTKERVQQNIERSTKNNEDVEKDVRKWLTDVSNAIEDAQKLSIEFLAPKDFIPFESRKPVFDQIIESMNDDNTHMVGLYGMRGVGKTTLATSVASRVKEQKIFYEAVMVLEESELGRGKRLYLRLKIEKKILIILDDVWDKLDLSTLGIPFGEDYMGCRILLTTRHQRVCTGMWCQRQILLNVLNENEGLDLLIRHASIGDGPSSTMIDMAKDIARECNGLPLEIVAIGDLSPLAS